MAIVFLTMNFEINLIFLIKPLFKMTKTAQAKIWTWDPGLWGPRPDIRGPGPLGFGTLGFVTCDPGAWDLDTWDLGNDGLGS